MAILVGIDEAGYGPILGPLVVSSSVFEIPEDSLRSNMWKLLSDSTSKEKRQSKGRLVITDSKKAYNRKAGLGHLERTLLASLKVLSKSPENLEALITALAPSTLDRLSNYPWYAQLEKRAIESQSDDISICASVFASDMKANQINLLSIGSDCLDVSYYNDMVEKVRNKAAVLFTSVCGHMQRAFDAYGDKNLQIIIDRQGGRSHYAAVLSKMFPDLEVRILREDDKDCSYQLSRASKSMKLHFVVKADDNFMPVALASMASKYLRELMVGEINSYFVKQIPDLKPTAGYWQDGLRFIKQLRENQEPITFDDKLLIRTR